MPGDRVNDMLLQMVSYRSKFDVHRNYTSLDASDLQRLNFDSEPADIKMAALIIAPQQRDRKSCIHQRASLPDLILSVDPVDGMFSPGP